MTLDIKNMYLKTDMEHYEYLRLPIELLTKEFIDLYKLNDKIHNGWVYCEIRKGMYDLPQAGMLAHRKLSNVLTAANFYPTKHTPGLCLHKILPIQFSLVVDDFGVKYVEKQHVDFLLRTLHNAKYETTEDWKGSLFCGISLKWDYSARKCWLSMTNYVKRVLARFHHTKPTVPENNPSKHVPPQY